MTHVCNDRFKPPKFKELNDPKYIFTLLHCEDARDLCADWLTSGY